MRGTRWLSPSLLHILILRSQEPLLEMYAHFLVRDRHLPLVELLRKEVLNNFETISSQK